MCEQAFMRQHDKFLRQEKDRNMRAHRQCTSYVLIFDVVRKCVLIMATSNLRLMNTKEHSKRFGWVAWLSGLKYILSDCKTGLTVYSTPLNRR